MRANLKHSKLHLLTPAILAFALTGCGDSGGDPTDSDASTDADTSAGTSAETGSETGDTTGDTGPGPTTGATDDTAADPTTDPTTTAPTTGDVTTGDTATDATTTDATTTDATTGGAAADCDFDDGVAWSRAGTIWQLRSDDGQTCVWLERRDDSEPDIIYKAVPYTLLELKAGHDGAVAHLTDAAKLSWESTHHNWLDVAEAWDDSVRYRLEDRFGLDFVDAFDLTAIDEQTDAVLWGPVRLQPYQP